MVWLPLAPAVAGTLYVNGGATLSGVGAVTGGLTQVATAGTVAPGTSPGCLSVADVIFTSGSNLSVELSGAAACTGYDQLRATGTVEVTGSSLILSVLNAFIPVVFDSFTVIDNDNADAIVGTFDGLPEAGIVNVSGVELTISYVGGDGNDITLVARSTQTITFNPLANKTYGGADFAISADATSLLTVSFTSLTPGVCAVAGSMVSLTGAGQCTIRASQPGGTHFYAAADVDQSFDVDTRILTVEGLGAEDKYYDGTTEVTLVGSPVLIAVINEDDVVLSGAAVGTFADPEVADNKPVTISGLFLAGADTDNYSLLAPVASASIKALQPPDAPIINTVIPGDASATISFEPPGFDGGSPVTSYTASCTPGPVAASGSNSPLTVTNLNNGQLYGCNVSATNEIGASLPSATLNVIPDTSSSADLSISKTNGTESVAIAAPTTYTIVVSNAGPAGVAGARVTDFLGPEFSSATWNCIGHNGGQCPAGGAGDIDTLVDLPSAGSVHFELTAMVAPSADPSVTNSARVEAPAGFTDENPENNVAIDGPDTVAIFSDGFE